jgi:hypothetical protein
MKDISRYAKLDPAIFTDGLFVPKANKNKAISIEREWDGGVIRFRGVQLGVAHQSVLLALCARAGRSGELIVKGSKNDLHATQIDLLECMGDAQDAATAIVDVTAYSLLIDADMGDGGTSYERLIQYLIELQSLVVYRKSKHLDKGGSSNVLKFSHSGSCFRISLNWRLANAILGDSQYVQISLLERNQLSDPVAKILHAWLSSNVRMGQTLGGENLVLLDTLISHVWGKCGQDGPSSGPSSNVIRQRRLKLKRALASINGVNDWICEEDTGKKWRIVRPKNLGNDLMGTVQTVTLNDRIMG